MPWISSSLHNKANNIKDFTGARNPVWQLSNNCRKRTLFHSICYCEPPSYGRWGYWQSGLFQFCWGLCQTFFSDTNLNRAQDIKEELKLWINIWTGVHEKRQKMKDTQRATCAPIPDNAFQALNKCNSALFPNINSLFITLCTLPFNSVECGRNGSALKRLKTYLRSTMGQSRLNGLALLYIHKDIKVDSKKVVRWFFLKSRKN